MIFSVKRRFLLSKERLGDVKFTLRLLFNQIRFFLRNYISQNLFVGYDTCPMRFTWFVETFNSINIIGLMLLEHIHKCDNLRIVYSFIKSNRKTLKWQCLSWKFGTFNKRLLWCSRNIILIDIFDKTTAFSSLNIIAGMHWWNLHLREGKEFQKGILVQTSMMCSIPCEPSTLYILIILSIQLVCGKEQKPINFQGHQAGVKF